MPTALLQHNLGSTAATPTRSEYTKVSVVVSLGSETIVIGTTWITDTIFTGPVTLDLGAAQVVITPLAETSPPEQELNAEIQPLRVARRNAADEFERRYVKTLLERTEGSITRGAELAEVSRQVIHKLISKHGL